MAINSKTIHVFLRLRNLSPHLKLLSSDTLQVLSPPKSKNDHERQSIPETVLFEFTGVIGPVATQADVYKASSAHIVSHWLGGHDCAILAYGQSGTGKTFTIEGDLTDERRRGILPRAVSDALSSQHGLLVSVIEVYCEQIFDLIGPKGSSLKIRESVDSNGKQELWVEGAENRAIADFESFINLYKACQENRKVGSTGLNARSSRSHVIVTLSFKSVNGSLCKLQIVDLAGSERLVKSKVVDSGAEEARSINLSLTVLGSVVSALNYGGSHRIPFRDSKLTRLLQSSLGSETSLSVICTISSDPSHWWETQSTLNFASRCANIRRRVVKPETRKSPVSQSVIDYILALEGYVRNLLLIYPPNLKDLRAELDFLPPQEACTSANQIGEGDQYAQLETSDCRELTDTPKVISRSQFSQTELTYFQADEAPAEQGRRKYSVEPPHDLIKCASLCEGIFGLPSGSWFRTPPSNTLKYKFDSNLQSDDMEMAVNQVWRHTARHSMTPSEYRCRSAPADSASRDEEVYAGFPSSCETTGSWANTDDMGASLKAPTSAARVKTLEDSAGGLGRSGCLRIEEEGRVKVNDTPCFHETECVDKYTDEMPSQKSASKQRPPPLNSHLPTERKREVSLTPEVGGSSNFHEDGIDNLISQLQQEIDQMVSRVACLPKKQVVSCFRTCVNEALRLKLQSMLPGDAPLGASLENGPPKDALVDDDFLLPLPKL